MTEDEGESGDLGEGEFEEGELEEEEEAEAAALTRPEATGTQLLRLPLCQALLMRQPPGRARGHQTVYNVIAHTN